MPDMQDFEQNEKDMLTIFRAMGFKEQCLLIGRLQTQAGKNCNAKISSNAAKFVPPQLQEMQGFLSRMEDLYKRLLSVHSIMVCIQCAGDYGDRATLLELPFAIGTMDEEVHMVASDLDDLCQEGQRNIKDYIKEA